MTIDVRSSSTETEIDCARRWAANSALATEIFDVGYALRHTEPSVGSYVGTGSHSGVAESWRQRAEAGGSRWGSRKDAIDIALAELDGLLLSPEGCQYDDVTPTKNAAQKAVVRTITSIRDELADTALVPDAIEQLMRCRVSQTCTLSGHTDCIATSLLSKLRYLLDLKTGRWQPTPFGQFGSYDLLAEANKLPIDKGFMVYHRRVPSRDPPAPVVLFPIDRTVARASARQAIARIDASVAAWRSDPQRTPFQFRANTGSKLCSDRWCPAFGTDWCPESRMKDASLIPQPERIID